ncbi:MAG: rRNA ((1405)-N(7))-methyltransferase [Acidobacteriota bacterium]|nr:rRNA ((1405)-N(7))-methyltransferase [Acidobacteriota bacterium]
MMKNTFKDDFILETGLAAEVIASIVDKAVKKYKIDAETAAGMVMETMEKHPKFIRLLEKGLPLKEIQKTRAYYDVSNKARRRIYYELRQYHKDIAARESLIENLSVSSRSFGGDYTEIINALAQSHVSTRERLSSLDIFYRELFKYIGLPNTILDVGSGLHPLLFPFTGAGHSVVQYIALDKDKTSISALEVFSKLLDKNILQPMNWNIKEGWRVVQERTAIRRFDAAFLLKLVPVVYRIQRGLLDILLETPAQTWVLSGSRTSMTKYVEIEKRERRIIKQFIQQSGKQIIGEFSTEDEFCIIVK